ncbi:MAG: adenosylhomocysteinase [Candidatus Gracilibacteria bacterium]|jgi:adenosylhomocysteinase
MPKKSKSASSAGTSLRAQGLRNLSLAEQNMGALAVIRERFRKEKPFRGLKIGMALHITKETGILARTLRDGGAKIWLASCNPLSTQDDVSVALSAEKNMAVFGHKGESTKEYYEYLERVASCNPDIVIDDGCDLTMLLKKYGHTRIIGGCEETTTGILRLKAMEKAGELPFPMIAVNDNKTKHLMDNLYGTGQSTLDGILRATNTMIAGKTAVVAGYGSCGKGVSMRLRGHGAQVIVTEVDPFRALQAIMDGFRVMPMISAAPLGDLFITVTGDRDVITMKHIRLMKDGAILCNSGHFDCEIDAAALRTASRRITRIRPQMEEFLVGGQGKGDAAKRVYLLGEGRLINLAAAEGHPSEVMSLSFCGQALACEYLVKNAGKLEKRVYTLPEEIDTYIAGLQLAANGIKIDSLTPAQKKYLSSWESGT